MITPAQITHLIAAFMGALLFYWRFETETKRGERFRTVMLFGAALQCYWNLLQAINQTFLQALAQAILQTLR